MQIQQEREREVPGYNLWVEKSQGIRMTKLVPCFQILRQFQPKLRTLGISSSLVLSQDYQRTCMLPVFSIFLSTASSLFLNPFIFHSTLHIVDINNIKNHVKNECGSTQVIPVLQGWRQEGQKFNVSLGYMRCCLKKKPNDKTRYLLYLFLQISFTEPGTMPSERPRSLKSHRKVHVEKHSRT